MTDPFTPDELAAINADMTDVRIFEAILAPLGIKGLVVACDDCKSDHYHTWTELMQDLESWRDTGTATSKPTNRSDHAGFATWDWCRGFLAGMTRDVTRWGPSSSE